MKKHFSTAFVITGFLLLALPTLVSFHSTPEKYDLTWCNKAPGVLSKADLQTMLNNKCLNLIAISSSHVNCDISNYTLSIKPVSGSHTFFMEQYGNTVNKHAQKLLSNVNSGDKIVIGNIALKCGNSNNLAQPTFTYIITK